jgi:hypothetical protein
VISFIQRGRRASVWRSAKRMGSSFAHITHGCPGGNVSSIVEHREVQGTAVLPIANGAAGIMRKGSAASKGSSV